ncbi:ORF1p [Mallotus japonicus virus B]|nr:ORF1p [Mallotus japonicus virus B]
MAFAGLDGGRQGLGAGGGNVPQAPRNLNDYHGIASDAEQTAKIQAEIQILTEHHVRIDQFTCAAVTAAGLTADQFIKLARVFTSVADQQMRVQLLSLGTRRSCWALHDQMTVKQFIGFCKFLKTGEGQKATHSAQRTLKLERKAGTTYQPSDIALVNVLTTQLQDMANVVKQTREEYDRQISELRLQIRQLEEQKEKSLRKAMRKFKPACFFKEPSRDEFNLECYSRYEREAQAKGRVAIPAGDIGFAHATTHFGNEVRQHHLSNFVKQEEYRQSLTKYLKDKILQFEQRGEHRQTEIFRNYMAVISGEAAADVTFETEEVGADDDTGGETGDTTEEVPDTTVPNVPGSEEDTPERPIRRKKKTTPRTGSNIAKRLKKRRNRQYQDQGDEGLGGGETPQDTNQ